MAARALRANPNGSVAVLGFIILVTLLPIVWMVLSAFKPDLEINQIPPTFLPHAFSLANFMQLFTQFNFGLLTINSILVSGAVVILSLAVIGIYAGKGPVWALSTEWLAASSAAVGLAQINAISNLAGFGTTYVMGFIRDTTGSYTLALMPLVALAGIAAVAILWIGRHEPRVALQSVRVRGVSS